MVIFPSQFVVHLNSEASTDVSSFFESYSISKEACFFGYGKFSKPNPLVNKPDQTSGDRCLAVPVPHDNQLCYTLLTCLTPYRQAKPAHSYSK